MSTGEPGTRADETGPARPGHDADTLRLHQLGYAQELRPPHVRLLQLRRLLHDHLDPVRLPDAVRVRA